MDSNYIISSKLDFGKKLNISLVFGMFKKIKNSIF